MIRERSVNKKKLFGFDAYMPNKFSMTLTIQLLRCNCTNGIVSAILDWEATEFELNNECSRSIT